MPRLQPQSVTALTDAMFSQCCSCPVSQIVRTIILMESLGECQLAPYKELVVLGFTKHGVVGILSRPVPYGSISETRISIPHLALFLHAAFVIVLVKMLRLDRRT